MNQHSEEKGRFGAYGGRYVAETLMPALNELTAAAVHEVLRSHGIGFPPRGGAEAEPLPTSEPSGSP